MVAISREEQRRAAQAKAHENYEKRNEGGFSGKRVIDLSKIGGFKKDLFYRPKDGINHIDILPYIVKTDQHPQGTKIGYTDYLLDIWVHRRVGPSESTFLCLKKMYGKACPICEELEELRKVPDVEDDEINALRPKRRCFYNVLNLDVSEKDQEMQIFEEAHYLFEKELIEKAGIKKDAFVEFWDIDCGKSITFRAQQKKSQLGKYFEYRIDDFEDRDPYNENIYKETFSFDEMLVIPTYDEVSNCHNGTDNEPEPEEKPAPSKREQVETRRKEEPKEEKTSSRQSRREEPKETQGIGRRPRKAEEPAEVKSSRRREKEESPKEDLENPCPSGYEFGADNDEHKECAECPKVTWDACADERDKLDKK